MKGFEFGKYATAMTQTSHPYSFKRDGHLKSRKAIGTLFQHGCEVRSNPIRLIYTTEQSDSFSYQVCFAAPKKIHHFAVDRNRNKRLMHEAFRLNRSILTDALSDCPVKLQFMFVAQNSSKMTFGEMEGRIKQILVRLAEKVKKEMNLG